MKALGFDASKPELNNLLRDYGVTAEGQKPVSNQPGQQFSRLYITQDAFTGIMTKKIRERDPLDEILRAFDLFAGVGSGGVADGQEAKIAIEDLRRVAKELGETLEEDELKAMIDEFDLDNDGMSMSPIFTPNMTCLGFCDRDPWKDILLTVRPSAEIVSRDEFISICRGD